MHKGNIEGTVLIGFIALIAVMVLISSPNLMETKTYGFAFISFEGEEAPPASSEPMPLPEPATVPEPQTAPQPMPEPQPAPEPIPVIEQPSVEMSAEEVYYGLPEEAQVYVTVEDIKAMESMGIDNQAAMEAEIAEMILEENGEETETGGNVLPPQNQEMPQGEYGDYGMPSEGQHEGGIGGRQGGPGGCQTEEECQAYCNEHPEECGIPSGGYNQQAGNGSYEMPEQMTGPGGCQTEEECMNYCMQHPEECGQPQGMIPQQQYEKTKQGPGGCKTMRECMEYCKDYAHAEECGRTGPPEDYRRGPEGMGPPDEIPEMILERGMEKHFIEIMCLEMHLHMAIPIQHSIKQTKEVFADAKKEFGLQSLNTSKLEAVNAIIEKRINALCNSNKDNFGDNINALMKLTMPGGQMEQAMRGIGDQLNEAFLMKIEPGEKNAIKRKEAEMEKEMLEMQLQNTEPDKRVFIQNRINELNAVISDTESGMTMQEIESFSSRMGAFMESVQGRMQMNFEESPEFIELQEKVYEKEYEFFLKMMEMGLMETSQGIQEMEKQGLDASALKEMKEFMESMKEKGKEMLKNPETKEQFFMELESRMPEFEKKINDSMKSQTKELFLPKAENNLIKMKNAVSLAKEKGINASELEELIKELEELTEELNSRIESAGSKEDFMEIGSLGKLIRKKMDKAKYLYEQLRSWPQ